jgi:hypothetical protein
MAVSSRNKGRVKDILMTTGIVAALLLGGIGTYEYMHPHTSTTTSEKNIWQNTTIYRNTTNNITTPYYHNTTYYDNTTHVIYHNITYIILIPVVNVTSINVNFTNSSYGTNFSIHVAANYSLPVGTTTWLNFSLDVPGRIGHQRSYNTSVNFPWTFILTRHYRIDDNVIVLLGVPRLPGIYAIHIIVSPNNNIH